MPNHPTIGKTRILETAERLFLARGYKAVSIREIAHACGVTNAALYYYFPSKEALFYEMLERHLAALAAAMRQAHDAAPPHPQPRLQAMLTIYAQWVLDKESSFFALKRDLGAVARRSNDPDRHRYFRQLAATILTPLEEVLQEAIAEGLLPPAPPAASLSGALLGMLHGALYNHRQLTSQDVHRLVQWVIQTFWNGLTASPPQGELP